MSRRFWFWGLGSIALAVVLWLPPVIQQLTGSPANFSILWDYFTQAPQHTIGNGEAVKLLLRHLNPLTLLSNRDGMTGSVVPGLAVGLIWVGAVVGAWRLRARDLLRLDLVLAVAGVLGIFSAARIFGYVWFYLVLWSWGIAALDAPDDRLDGRARPRGAAVGRSRPTARRRLARGRAARSQRLAARWRSRSTRPMQWHPTRSRRRCSGSSSGRPSRA